MTDTIESIALKHGFSAEAAHALADSIRRGGGGMAQFSHPELGGMGQWTAGGMIMIGDMFNNGLKARVAAFCADLAAMPVPVATGSAAGAGAGYQHVDWWPAGLGYPSATGAQNDMRYACFPDSRRLAVMLGGTVRVYDTGEHRIGGFSQQQSGTQSLRFHSQLGDVSVDQFREV